MSQIHARGFCWTPLGSQLPILKDIDLDIGPGERVLLAGTSGAGKSTLLRAISGVLDSISPGDASGVLTVDGQPPVPGSGQVVLVSQNPQDAKIAATVGRDVAFGPENLGLPRDQIWQRVDQALAAVRFPYGREHPTSALSGGQMQRLALAGALAMRPGILILDEPLSMLDEPSAVDLRQTIAEMVAETSATLLVADHDLAGWVDLVDRLVVLDAAGSVLADGDIEELLATRHDELLDLGLWVPGAAPPPPVKVDTGILTGITAPAQPLTADEITVVRRSAPGLRVADRRARTVALDGAEAVTSSGQFLALHGPSGAGKSTLIDVMCGLRTPDSGQVTWGGDEPSQQPDRWDSRVLASRIGWVPQFASATIAGHTVLESLQATTAALGQNGSQTRNRALALLDALNLSHCAQRNPMRLSGGEQRRLAVATAALHCPPVLALDEPTVGLDRQTWAAVTGVLLAAREAGSAVVASSHDQHLLAWADQSRDLTPPPQPPEPKPKPPRGLLSRCNPLALLLTVLIFLVGGMCSSDLGALACGVVTVGAAGVLLTGARFPVIRLLPGVIGVASIAWSNWLLSDSHSLESAAIAGLRVAFIVLPGLVVVSYLDPTRLGDQLGQMLKLPARPVLAIVASLQRLDDLGERWNQLSMARRSRGLLPGRSPAARVRHAVSLMFALLVDAIRQAGRLTVAMEVRGYSAPLNTGVRRSWAEPAVWSRADTQLTGIAVILAFLPLLLAFVW